MKIFSAAQIRQWDQYTILHEPISSVDLMERASGKVCSWLLENCPSEKNYKIFCGAGNNGGDGLAVARMLCGAGKKISVYILQADKYSPDCETNLQRLIHLKTPVHFLNTANDFPPVSNSDIIIDALFGTGLTKPAVNFVAELINYLNNSAATIISIDIPSGLFADESSEGNAVIHAAHTLSFQCHKLAFMIGQNEKYTGEIHILDIGLHDKFYEKENTTFFTVGFSMAKSFFKPRKNFTHKYNYGNALLFAGSKNYMGAAILCAKTCLRSGAGLVTVRTDEELMHIIQTAVPEVIATAETETANLFTKKAAIGFGPGLELNELNKNILLKCIIEWEGPLVIDAAAFGLLKNDSNVLKKKKNVSSILTPHAGEFEKVFGKSENDFERMKKASAAAVHFNCYVILKGYRTLIACPGGNSYFNTTGNSGMATAGSGDVLTGILTGLLAQGYNAEQACILGVYIHGMAGDFAAEYYSKEAMMAGDIIEQLGDVFKVMTASSAF